MKTYVITLSQAFLQGHPKAGQPTYFTEQFLLGQGQNIDELPGEFRAGLYPKIHTIRGNYEMWAKRIAEVQAGDAVLSVRRWLGVAYRSKQVEIARLTNADGVGVQKFKVGFWGFYSIDGVDDDKIPVIYTLSANDGLSLQDFRDWFRGYDFNEPMAIIHFTPFRY